MVGCNTAEWPDKLVVTREEKDALFANPRLDRHYLEILVRTDKEPHVLICNAYEVWVEGHAGEAIEEEDE